MSRTNRFLTGIGFGYSSQILTTLVAFWLTPFLLHRIGQHDYGLWLVGTQVLFYLGLLDLGIVGLLPRETAYSTGRKERVEDAQDLPLMIGQTFRLIIWQMPLVATSAAVAWCMMPAAWEGLREPIGVVLVVFVVAFPLRVFAAVLQGLQDFAFVGRVGIIAYLISTGITVVLVVVGWGLYSLAAGWATLQLINAVSSYYRLRSHFPGVLPPRLPSLPWSMARKRLTQGSWVSLNQIAQVLLNGTDILIIGKLFGPAAVVPFIITGKLIGVLANQPQMLMAAAGPALSQMRMGVSRRRLADVCIALGQAMLLVSGAVFFVVLLINQSFIGRWVGLGQYGGFWLTVLLLTSMLLRHWNVSLIFPLFSFGHERRLCITAVIEGTFSVGAVYILVRHYGLLGAPLGMILGVCIVSLPVNLLAMARECGMSVSQLVQPLAPWFIRFVVLIIAAGALVRIWMPNALLLIGLTGAAGSLIYLALMFPLALRYPLGDYVKPRILPLGNRMIQFLGLRTSA